MRTIEVNLYSFAELNEAAQKKAHEDWARDEEAMGNPWNEENYQSAKAFAKLFPITVREYDSERGVSFYFRDIDFHFCDADTIKVLSGQRLATWLWNNLRDDIFKGKYYSKYRVGDNKYISRRSKIILESNCPLTGYYADDDMVKVLIEFMKKPDPRTDMEDLINEAFGEWQKAVEVDNEYRVSMEAFKEACDANEYEFDEYGEMQ